MIIRPCSLDPLRGIYGLLLLTEGPFDYSLRLLGGRKVLGEPPPSPVAGERFEGVIPQNQGRRKGWYSPFAFDSVEKAKEWESSPAQKEIDDMRHKSAKARAFIVEGATN